MKTIIVALLVVTFSLSASATDRAPRVDRLLGEARATLTVPTLTPPPPTALPAVADTPAPVNVVTPSDRPGRQVTLTP